jgi:hypothetical protein
MTIFHMPDVYVPPFNTPLFWKDEQSGVLRNAVRAYLGHGLKPEEELPDEQVELVRAYLDYVIHAPCWQGDKRIPDLRARVKTLETVNELDEWIDGCLELGIDPL